MKKTYETPSVELVKFQYRDQVVAGSGADSETCIKVWINIGGNWCEGDNSFQEWKGNQR